jgi:hypothetical protein
MSRIEWGDEGWMDGWWMVRVSWSSRWVVDFVLTRRLASAVPQLTSDPVYSFRHEE